jgi:hypothetical protein
MFTKAFWTATIERAVKTGAQLVASVYVVGDRITDKFTFDWGDLLQLAAGGAVASLLTSLASIPLSTGDSPSLVPASEVEAASS